MLVLPWLLSDRVHPSMLVFIVIYGLDWVATVPPTAVLCRQAFGEERLTVLVVGRDRGAGDQVFGEEEGAGHGFKPLSIKKCRRGGRQLR